MNKYIDDLLRRTYETAEEASLWEKILYFPYLKTKPPKSQADKERDQLDANLEQLVHDKLERYRQVQVSFLGYSLVLFIYLIGFFSLILEDANLSVFWITSYALSILASSCLLIMAVINSKIWMKASVHLILYIFRLVMHLHLVLLLLTSKDTSFLVKLALIKSAEMVRVLINGNYIGLMPLKLISAIVIVLQIHRAAGPDDQRSYQIITLPLTVLLASSLYEGLFQWWKGSEFDNVVKLLDLAIEKLVLHLKVYNTLGGEPTFWHRTPKEEETSLQEKCPFPCLTQVTEVNKNSTQKTLKIDTAVLTGVKSPKTEKTSKLICADLIKHVLNRVYYTEKTKITCNFEGIPRRHTEDINEPEFKAFNSLRLMLAHEVSSYGKLSMEKVWVILVDCVLSKFNCTIKLSHLQCQNDLPGQPNNLVECRFTAISFWSKIEDARLYFSKLEKEESPSLLRSNSFTKSELIDEQCRAPLKRSETVNIQPLIHSNSAVSNDNHKTIFKHQDMENEKINPLMNCSDSRNINPPDHAGEEQFFPEDFIPAVVHDMRSPLTCVLGNLELLDYELKNYQNLKVVHPLLKSSVASCALLETLINDLLDSTRISKGIFDINPQKMNLEETLKECMSIFELAAKAKKVKMHLDYQAAMKSMTSDKRRLKQVMNNFLSNAIKFTRDGDVWITVQEEGESIKISITDTGTGINPTILPNLFKKFTSDRQSKSNKGGIGLGLFICKSIISKIGPNQEIEVKSSSSQGTTFTFTIYKEIKEKSVKKQICPNWSDGASSQFMTGNINLQKGRSLSLEAIKKLEPKFRSSLPHMTIFDLNNQFAQESKRLILMKKKWDMTWLAKQDPFDSPYFRKHHKKKIQKFGRVEVIKPESAERSEVGSPESWAITDQDTLSSSVVHVNQAQVVRKGVNGGNERGRS